MPAFHYQAVDKKGAKKSGVLYADSVRLARIDLRNQGLLPLIIQAAAQGETATGRFGSLLRKRLSSKEIASFTRQLASLLEAGLPLEQALAALSEQAEQPHQRTLIRAIRADVVGGASFASALALYPASFPHIYRSLVTSGEQTGKLAQVLAQLAEYWERRNQLLQKIRLAFTYPVIVTITACIIVIFLLTYVVPQIVSVFITTKQKLPLLTSIMLELSRLVREQGIYLFLACLLLFLLFRIALLRPDKKIRWHGFLLRLPVYGRFERSLNTARFSRTLSITVASGLPILDALKISLNTVSNIAMRRHVDIAAERVREGVGLADALSVSKCFSPMLIHMIRAGEATGELSSMLLRAASVQEQDLEQRSLAIAGLLEPVLILLMGAVVLLIVLAVLMPIIEMNQMIR